MLILHGGLGSASAQDAPLATAPTNEDTPPEVPSQITPTDGVSIYTPEYFQGLPVITAMDMLNFIAGFSVSGGGDVRGYAGSVGNVLIDGDPPASKDQDLEDVIRRVPASQVERIEIVRGAAPGYDMRGQTVLANIVRKSGGGSMLAIALANDTFWDGRNKPGLRIEGSRRSGGRMMEGLLLAYTFADDGLGEGPRVRADGSGAVIEDAVHDSWGGGKGLDLVANGLTPLLGGRLRVNGSLKFNEYEFQFVDTSTVRAQNDDDASSTKGEIGFHYDHGLGPNTDIEVLALTRRADEDFTSIYVEPGVDAVFNQEKQTGETIGRAVLRWSVSPSLSFETGGEAAFNYLDSRIAFQENGSPVPLPSANIRVEEKRSEAFASGTWRINRRLTLESGVRYETSTITQSGDASLENSFAYAKPRALLTWTPSAKTQVRLRVEKELGQLDFNDFVSAVSFSNASVDAGNPNLRPDQTWVGEVAIERGLPNDALISLTATSRQISDAIDRIPVFQDLDDDGLPDDIDGDLVGDVFDAPGNIGDGTAQQLTVNLSVPLAAYGMTAGFVMWESEWSTSEVVDPTTGERRRRSGENPFNHKLSFDNGVPRWKMGWGFEYIVGRRETYYRVDEVRRNEWTPWLQIYANYRPAPGWSLRMEASNLLSRDIIQTRQVHDGPRSTAALLFEEKRTLNFRPWFFVRLRRTFN